MNARMREVSSEGNKREPTRDDSANLKLYSFDPTDKK